jgi:hypothetical protein
MFAVAAPDGMTCGSAGSPRLQAVAGNRFTSVCQDDLWEFVFRSACFPSYIPQECLDTAIVGDQPQCALWDDGGSYPQCGAGITGPCWRFESKPGYCPDGAESLVVDRGELDPPDRDNVVEVQCVKL